MGEEEQGEGGAHFSCLESSFMESLWQGAGLGEGERIRKWADELLLDAFIAGPCCRARFFLAIL